MSLDLENASWRKSSRSGAGNDCVELVIAEQGMGARDSKNPNAGHLVFDADARDNFRGSIRKGNFDL